MRISNIYSKNNISFGYDKKLNAELKAQLKDYPDRAWADTLDVLNTQCNAIEQNIRKEAHDTSINSRFYDYLDMFLSLKELLTGFVSVTFPDMRFADREYIHYEDEYVKNQQEKSWLKDVCDNLQEWVVNVPYEDVLKLKESDTQQESPLSVFAGEDSSKLKTSAKKSSTKDSSLLQKYEFSKDSPKGFSDVIGLDDLKMDFKEGIIDYLNNPLQAKVDYEEYGITLPSAFLLYGPPGCGKTFIVEALAAESGLPLYFFNLSSVGSNYINQTSKNIKAAVDDAIEIAKETNKPCLVFMDEVDTLGFDRNSQADNEDMKQVGTMLQEIDRAKKNNVIIGATNKYNLLDPAIRRRFENPYFIGLPDTEAIKALIHKELSTVLKASNLLGNDKEVEKIANLMQGYSNKSICIIIENAKKMAKRRGRADISVDDFIKSIELSNQEKPDIKDYMPESLKQGKIGF